MDTVFLVKLLTRYDGPTVAHTVKICTTRVIADRVSFEVYKEAVAADPYGDVVGVEVEEVTLITA